MQQPSVNGRLHDVIGKCTPVAAGHALFAGIGSDEFFVNLSGAGLIPQNGLVGSVSEGNGVPFKDSRAFVSCSLQEAVSRSFSCSSIFQFLLRRKCFFAYCIGFSRVLQ